MRPQLINGGRVDREYGLGRRRIDLCVIWNYPGGVQRGVIELKLLHNSLERTLAEGLEQTWRYATPTPPKRRTSSSSTAHPTKLGTRKSGSAPRNSTA